MGCNKPVLSILSTLLAHIYGIYSLFNQINDHEHFRDNTNQIAQKCAKLAGYFFSIEPTPL